ncbi:hypothetical protein [Glutamicibacter protophormiae]|uniref:hypothetical protein n=1 Tax=Glutamicibacter protophormiae TaxID=37930 RepID=UPI001959894C|nr:hypothetical protein [Glutamicibacter protophormiae]QRQ79399.1 hypothetical protein JQN66_04015 [Glutamicibacter protophormiae]
MTTPAGAHGYREISPSEAQWAEIPRRLPRPVAHRISWLLALLTTAGIFLGFRHWADLEGDAWAGGYRLLDVLGLASIGLMVFFSLGGWYLHRFNMGLSPLLLGLAATAHTLDSSPEAPFWWAGTLLAGFWLLVDFLFLLRQTLQVRSLARSLPPGSELIPERSSRTKLLLGTVAEGLWALGAGLLAAGLWWWTLQIFAEEQGRTAIELEQASESDLWAAPALLAAALSVVLLLRVALRCCARGLVGRYAWHLPFGAGPVELSWLDGERAGGQINTARDTTEYRCICVAELVQMFPEDEQDIRSSSEVSASNHCPIHGIDAINLLEPRDFASLAGSLWLWDELSPLPHVDSASSGSPLLIGYCGGAFPGYPGTSSTTGTVEILDDAESAVEVGRNEEEGTPYPASAPSVGVVDKIDLRPFGIKGHAVRFRHARAWFVPET